MLKSVLMAAVVAMAMPQAAFAACTSEDAMNKASDVSGVLMEKVSSKPDEASKMMSEIGTVTGTGTVTAETCSKLDALMVRAKKL